MLGASTDLCRWWDDSEAKARAQAGHPSTDPVSVEGRLGG